MMQSSGFREEMFTQRTNYEEGPLRDRKKVIPNLRDNRQQPEFLRDIIALANSARYFGESAYMLFGIDDDMRIQGISSSLAIYEEEAYRKLGGRQVEQAKFEETLWQEVIGRIIQKELIGQYIDAELAGICQLKYGLVNECQCAYLIIPPVARQRPYSSQKSIQVRSETLFSKGEYWIRIGESKDQIPGELILPDGPYFYSAFQVPHPFPSKWREYFDKLVSNLREASEILNYQNLTDSSGVGLSDIVDRFLEDGSRQILMIAGKAGTGKTVFLQRLVYELATQALHEMEQNIAQERFDSPSGLIPIHIPLWGWETHDLQQQILDCLNGQNLFWRERPETPEKMLDSEDFRWIICFDGLDEIWTQEGRRHFLEGLKHFRRSHPSVKIVLTTRPDVTGLCDGQVVTVAPFSEPQIENYLAALIRSEQLDEIMQFLRSEPDLWELCGTPTFLEAAVKAWADNVHISQREPVRRSVDAAQEPTNYLFVPEEIPDQSLIEITEIESLIQENIAEVLDQHIMSEIPQVDYPVTNPVSEETKREEDLLEDFVVPIRKGRVLDTIYRHIWDRELNRKPLPIHQPDQWFDETGHLAAFMDSRRKGLRQQEIKEYIDSEEGLNWVLSLGILRIKPRSHWVGFVTNMTQSYFAASFLQACIEEQDTESPLRLIRQGKQGFWEITLQLLRDIQYTDISELESIVDQLSN